MFNLIYKLKRKKKEIDVIKGLPINIFAKSNKKEKEEG